jgi:hypothetical protein
LQAARAQCSGRLKQAGESIRIVARYHSAVCWQTVHQVCVAVVYDMKQIESFLLPAKPPRIFHKTIQGPLDPVNQPEVPKVSTVCGAQTLGLKIAKVVPLKVLQQHVSHQVHARPVFLEEVTDNANTGQTQAGWRLRQPRLGKINVCCL